MKQETSFYQPAINLCLKCIQNNEDLFIVFPDHLQKTKNDLFKYTGDTNYNHKNELDKACFQHDIAYGNFKNIARRTASDKVLRDKAFNIAKNPKYDGYQRGFVFIFTNFLIKSPQVVVLCM